MHDLVNDTAHNTTQIPIKSGEFSATSPVGSEWITLSVLNCNHYIENMPIEIHLRARTVTNHRKDFCIVFDLTGEWHCGAISPYGKNSREAYIPLDWSSQGQMQELVLVGISEITKDREERWKGWMRSIVRLRQLDSCPNWIAYRPKVFPVIDGFIESRFVIRDGELQTSLMKRGIGSSFVNGNCVNQMVKSVPQIIQGVGDQQGPPLKGRGLVNPNDDAVSSALRVFLSNEAIRVSVRPSGDFILEGLSVFLAPRQFSANACEV
jgi:hypothetical protein